MACMEMYSLPVVLHSGKKLNESLEYPFMGLIHQALLVLNRKISRVTGDG